MGDADVAEAEVAKREQEEQKYGIPGLDWSYEEKNEFERKILNQHDRKKAPYARPVPRAFVAAWEANKEGRPADRDRPRSPRFREFERDQRRWRDRRDDRPRDWGRGPMRHGPEHRPNPDDDRVYVDGIEVGPDFDPERIKSGPDNPRPPGPDHPPLPPPAGPGMSPPRGRRLSDVPPPTGGPGPIRDFEEKRRMRENLYAEVARSGNERDIELLRELEEYGLPLEEEELFFDPNVPRMGGVNEMDRAGPGPADHPFPRDRPPMDGRMMDGPPPIMRGFPDRDGDRFRTQTGAGLGVRQE